MSLDINPQNSTFWRICDNLGQCHCDFRYTIAYCQESYIGKSLYIATAIASAVLGFVNILLVYFLVIRRKQKVFIMRNGFPRPRPLQSMTILGVIFNTLQFLQSMFSITNAFPNPIFRSFMHDIGFQFGYSCLACYLFGVAYTLADTSHAVYNSWVKSDIVVNILYTLTLLLPTLTNTTSSILAGYYASKGNNEMASKFTQMLYYCWSFYCLYLGTLLLFAGIRLLRLLNQHLLVQTDFRPNMVRRFKYGALRVKIILVACSAVLYIFAFLLLLYSICREALITNSVSNMVVAAVWLFIGPIAVFFVELAIIINPAIVEKLGQPSFGLSSNESCSSRKEIITELEYTSEE